MQPSSPPTESMLHRLMRPQSTLAPALIGSLLCTLSLPPAGLSLLAWIGTVPWLILITLEQLPGRRPYHMLWLAGFFYWLLTIHWIRLPHAANYVAWMAISTYLGVYLPAFIALARVGVHRWRLPLSLTAPVTYVGLDWLRGWVVTGFSLGSLCHSQANNLKVIQIADLGGEYTVTFVLLLVAASLTSTLVAITRATHKLKPALHLGVALMAIVGTLGYGTIRTSEIETNNEASNSVRVALIQGDIRADWKSDPAKQQRIMDEYIGLSLDAVNRSENVDLVIWPETSFRQALITLEPSFSPPVGLLPPQHIAAATDYLKQLVDQLEAPLMVGIDRLHCYALQDAELMFHVYNSSVMIDRQGNNLGTYDKMHLVPFGEFIPLTDWLPFMRYLTPVAGGAVPGENPTGLLLDDVLYVPNICYESAVPRLIRRQVNAVEAEFDRRPDVLVNLTNDAWYWGSSQLDQHLACSVFRAVEMRLPHLMVANGGLTANIDALGNVLAVSERQTSTSLIAEVTLRDLPPTLYSRWGNWLALTCVVCCVALGVWECSKGWRKKSGE